MPIQSSFGALTYTKGNFFSTTTGNGWINVGTNVGVPYIGNNSNNYLTVGTGIAVDNGGNVYIPTANLTSNIGYVYKFDANNGNNLWKLTPGGEGCTVQTSGGNAYISTVMVTVPNGIPTFNFQSLTVDIANNILATKSNVSFTGNITQSFNFPQQFGAREVLGNVIFNATFGASGTQRYYVCNLQNKNFLNGLSVPAGGGSGILFGSDFCADYTGNNIFTISYFVTLDNQPHILVNSTGNNQLNPWQVEVGNIGTFNSLWRVNCIAADDNFVYVGAPNGCIVKLSNNGTYITQKRVININAITPFKLATDNLGNVYVLNLNSITKLDNNLNLIWTRQFQTQWAAGVDSGPIGLIIKNNYIYISVCQGVFNNNHPTRIITMKVPADGSIPGKGIYRAGQYYVYYRLGTDNTAVSNVTIQNVNYFTTVINSNANNNPTLSTVSLSASNDFSKTTI